MRSFPSLPGGIIVLSLLLVSCGQPASEAVSAVSTDTASIAAPVAKIARSEPSPCAEDKAASFIGAIANSATRKVVQSAAGHTQLRWITPGQAITLDFNQARLNVILDERNKIAAMRCG